MPGRPSECEIGRKSSPPHMLFIGMMRGSAGDHSAEGADGATGQRESEFEGRIAGEQITAGADPEVRQAEEAMDAAVENPRQQGRERDAREEPAAASSGDQVEPDFEEDEEFGCIPCTPVRTPVARN